MAENRATVGVTEGTKIALESAKRPGITWDLFLRELLSCYIAYIENTEDDVHITNKSHGLKDIMEPPQEPLQ
jgi:hypothetical protein